MKYRLSKKSVRFFTKLLALLVMACVLVTSSSAVIALDAYHAARELNQQVFTITPEDGVTVTLSGIMPVKGYAEAEPAEVEEEGVLHAYDITIRYPDGSEFEPEQDAPVSVRFESAAIADAIADKSTSLAVEHITDGGETESVYLSVAEDDRAEFLATGFSVYLIKEEHGDLITPRKTFWYLDSNWNEYSDNTGNDNSAYYVSGLYKFPNTAGEMISTQIVKNGEKLHPIVLPENHDWGAFYGWYIVTLDFEKSQAATIFETGKTAEEIKGVRDLTRFVYKWVDNPTLIMAESKIEVTKDEDVFLAPHYSRYRFVNFHEHVREGEEDTSNIVARKLLVLGNNISDTIDISDVSANSPDPEHKIFYGWQYGNRVIQTRRATGDIIPQSITVTEEDLNGGDSVDLYAVFKDARWIYFVQGERDWNARYLGAMFAYLYDETIPAEERVNISQLPTTTRTGYIFDGWYTGHLDENEHIVYEQQVSMALKDASVVGNSSIITTEGETITIGTQGSYIHMGKLYLKEELTLYAKWRPVNTADVKVVVWKQKASDNKNASNDAKTYDYYDYKLLEDQETGSVALDNSAFIDLHFEDLADSPIEKYQKDFRGFHYDRTMVAVNNHVYDGNIPSERVNGVVAPDGTTVINIYYDRNLMAINFYYTSSYSSYAPDGAVDNDNYVYKEGSPTSNPLFGIVNNEYVQLSMSSTPESYYVYRYEYYPVDNSDTGAGRFGVVGDEYVQLTRNLLYNWTKTGTWYELTTERNTSKYYTGIRNGAFVTVSYSKNRKEWRASNTKYTGSFYNQYTNGAKGEYNGSRYVLSGGSVVASTSTDPATQYSRDGDGNLYELSRSDNGAEYLYNNTVYSGTRYARTEYKKTSFMGDKRYKKTENGFVETTDETGTLYGKRGDNYEEIVKETKTVYTYTLQSDPNTVYEGPIYTQTYKTGFAKRLTWTGLYGQTFAQAGYSWSDVNSIKWMDRNTGSGSGTNQTLLDSFLQTFNPYNLESDGNSGSYEIRHLKQQIDGTYTNNPYIAKSGNSSSSFTFENKFYGFEVVGYSSGTNNAQPKTYDTDQGVTPVKEKDSETISRPFYVYHRRVKHHIHLVNYYSAEDQQHAHERDLTVPSEIPYEAGIATYMKNYQNPPERENYEFAGWYLDKGCTKRADTATMTMPAESLALYAKWDLKYYFVEIDPNGGEMEDQTEFSAYTGITSPRKQSTYTWLQYGQKLAEYANVERNYVPDEHGDYVYVNVKFAEDFATAQSKDWDLSLPSKCRAAFYCLESDLRTVYDQHFGNLPPYNSQPLLTYEQFVAYCVDNSHKYRRAEGVEGYTLAAWYKVNDDGTTSNELYNFRDIVTKPTRIRAVWRKTGEYYVQYDPFMRGYNIGRVVEKDGQTYVNPVTYEPIGVNDPAQHVDKLADNAEIEIGPAPEHIPPNYTFKGWQLLDHDGNYADNVPTKLVHEKYNIDSSYADQNGAIHFEAVYEPEAASVRRVPTASLVLDASGGRVQRNNLDIYEENKIYVDLVNEQVLFKKQPNNFDVNLKDYYDNFLNDDGKVLVGWSKKQNPTEADINFKADDIIGVDINNNDTDNILYAVWEPMYYLTIENHSTEFDVTFTLSFTGNGENNKGLVYCYADEEGGTHLYERHLLSEGSHENMTAEKQGDNLFKITMKRATKEGDVVHPNSERLVLPEGATATYTVSGNVANVKQNESTSLKNTGIKLSVYNSGGASEEMTPFTQSAGVYQYRNKNNTTTDAYSVTGDMKLGNEGQKIAFYTGDTTQTSIYISAYYYDPGRNEWQREDSTHHAPGATLQFVDIYLGDGVSVITHDGEQGIEGLSIIQGQSSTFGISESYTNSAQYKFIGWYDSPGATPRDVPIDGVGTNPNNSIDGMRVPNESVKFYYALYVPLADGNITISHDEKQSSIGYPKQMLVSADLGDTHVEDLVTTKIYSIAARNGEKVHTGITFHVSESDTRNITITLGAMSGYGCVYSNTYEGLDMLDRTETDTSHDHYFADGGIMAVVYYDPTKTQYQYTPGEDIGNGETKHLYKHIITKKVSDLFEESETVKGYKILRDLQYTSDFERKYEFVYNYKFRDGTTQRRSVVTGSTAVYNSDDDFKAFVAKSAPYITNFGEDLEWDLASIQVAKLLDKGRVTATMNAVQPKKLAKVMVKTEGSAIEIPHQVSVGETFPVGQMPTAELIRNGTQFYRWEIRNTATKELIGYCYWHEFTFKVWDDITITAQYVPLGEDGEYHRYYPDDETTSYITIQHLESTRNSWVALDENGEIIRSEKDLPKTYYDTLYDDYSILFVDKGLRINTNAEKYKVGLIYEIVGEIEDEEVPEAYSRNPDPELRMRAIRALVKRGNDTYGTINSGGKPKFYYSQFDPAELSNDNRMEFYRGINNLKTEAGLNPNAKYVFDVYAYMQLPSGEIIQSEQPITLQLYRLAVKETAQ